jgi:predicted transcriptional regulator
MTPTGVASRGYGSIRSEHMEPAVAETTFTFRLDDDLKQEFARLAADQERTAAQLLRVLMREAVQRDADERAHDRWFRAEVQRALAEADDDAVRRPGHDEVRATWSEQRIALEEHEATYRS